MPYNYGMNQTTQFKHFWKKTLFIKE